MANAFEIVDYLKAGFSGFWINTVEPRRIGQSIIPLIQESGRKVIEWQPVPMKKPHPATGQEVEMAPDIADAFKMLQEDDGKIVNEDGEEQIMKGVVCIVYNPHWFFEKNPLHFQTIQSLSPLWANAGKAVVFVAPNANIPKDVEKDITLLSLPFPDAEEACHIMDTTLPEKFQPKGEDREVVCRSCMGLTQTEIANVAALSIVRAGKVSSAIINEFKSNVVEKTGFLSVVTPNKTFEEIVGYDKVKSFMLDMALKAEAKGSLLMGPPGTAKTSLVMAVVGELAKMGHDTLGVVINIGKLFSKYVGETDANVDYTINFLSSLGNVLCIIDEFEKQFSGVGSGDDGTGGTTIRANAKWLDFLQNRPEGIKVYGTANSFNGIPGEYLRPGRWDCSPFFVDLPTEATKKAILKFYIKKNGLKEKQKLPTMEKWTGAEIEAMCSIARLRDLPLINAAMFIRPTAIAKGDIAELREMAKRTCIDAEEVITEEVKPKNLKRKIER